MNKKNPLNNFVVLILLGLFILTRLWVLGAISWGKTHPLGEIDVPCWKVENTFIYPIADQVKEIYLKVSLENKAAPQQLIIKDTYQIYTAIRIDNTIRDHYIQVPFLFPKPDGYHDLAIVLAGPDEDVPWEIWDFRTDIDPNANHVPFEINKPQNTHRVLVHNPNLGKNYLIEGLAHWDVSWYRRIIEEGYSFDGDFSKKQTVGFASFYPWTAGLFARYTLVDTTVALILINNLFVLISLFFIYLLSCEIIENRWLRFVPAFFILIHPYQIFLISGYSEGMFICIASIALWLLLKKNYWGAAMVGGTLSGIRAVGIIFPVLIAVDYFLNRREPLKPSNILRLTGECLVSIWGILFSMYYLLIRFQDPWVYFKIQQAWVDKNILTTEQYCQSFFELFTRHPMLLNPELAGFLLITLLFLFSIYTLNQAGKDNDRIGIILALFSVLVLFIPLFDRLLYVYPLGRFSLAAFPAWILMFRKYNKTKLVIFGFLAVLFIIQMAIFAIRFSYQQSPF